MAQFDGFLIDSDEGELIGLGIANSTVEFNAAAFIEEDSDLEAGLPGINPTTATQDGNMTSGTV